MPAKTLPYTVQVRWADLDVLGHVNHAKYFEYAMEARVKFRIALAGNASDDAGAFVLRQTDMEYLRSVSAESGPLTIESSMARIGRTSASFRHVMRDAAGQVCAIANAVMVGFDLTTKQQRPLSDTERAAFSEYLADPSESAPS